MMVEMTVIKVLFEYDEPLVLQARDDKQRDYVCLNTSDAEQGSNYLVTYVYDHFLQQFLNQEVDLRFLIQDGVRGVYRIAKLFGEPGEKFNAKPYKESVEEMLPRPGFFLPTQKAPASNREVRSITIDGKWGIDDLKSFPGLVQDVYAFVFSLKSDDPKTRASLKNLFQKYPWRGGYSALNFFNDVYKSIPRSEEARIFSMSYASLGSIKIEVDKEIAEYIRKTLSLMQNNNDIHNLYSDIHGEMQRNKWLGRATRDMRLSSYAQKEIRQYIIRFSRALDLRDREQHVLSLAQEDPLAAIKILLSFYRKLARLDDYVRTGRARDIFTS